jgi:hypothetical protein
MGDSRDSRFAALKVKKLFEKKLARLNEEIELWEGRLEKAQAAERRDLVAAAETKLTELREDQRDLQHKLSQADKLVARADVEAPPELTPTDRAELLQRDLEALVGADAATRQELDDAALAQEAAAELERLKGGGSADDDLADL